MDAPFGYMLSFGVTGLASEGLRALAKARGQSPGDLMRELVERELAASSSEVAEALANPPSDPGLLRRAMEEAFPLAKTLAESEGQIRRAVRSGG